MSVGVLVLLPQYRFVLSPGVAIECRKLKGMALGWFSVAYCPRIFPANWLSVSRVEIKDA